MPILDKDKPTTSTPETPKSTPAPPQIFVVPPPRPPAVNLETPPATPIPSTSKDSPESEFDFSKPADVILLTDTIQKLRTKDKEREETMKNLRDSNSQHVKDKNQLKRELAAERAKVSQLLSRTITNPEKRKICEDLLKPYMGENAVKCFIDGRGGKFSKVREWSRDEIIFGITLRTISRKAYNFLREKDVYPLPCESTLRKKYADFQLQEGKLHSIFYP